MNLHSIKRTQYLINIVDEDFDQQDPARAAFIRIVEYILSKPKDTMNKLSFGMLAKIAGLNSGDGIILHRAIAYLIGERAKVLEMKYEFQDGDYFHELTDDEQEEFIANETFAHPKFGIDVPNCKAHIYVFFRPIYGEMH